MAVKAQCPECGSELTSGELEGLCPKCLMKAGFEIGAKRDDSDNAAAWDEDLSATTPKPGAFVPPDPESLRPHFPSLEIISLLGHGGMGAVYKARQTKLDRLVALKIIRPESADDLAFAERFNREAKTLARLSHPNIIAIHDFGDVNVSSNDAHRPITLFYFVMEYADGANLRQLMHRGELSPQKALAIVPQICEALQFAHEEGIIHRDIKPENILLDSKGHVKIADFGLAKLASNGDHNFTLTGTHQVMGTPKYMAPEQMEGSHAVDHRADIYSLGVVFYEMLTGQVPVGHFDPPSKKVEVDVRLDEVVLRSLAREPERRYQQASDVRVDVEAISDDAHHLRHVVNHATPRTDEKYAWSTLAVVTIVVLPLCCLIGFSMVWTGSAWALAGLALPWFILGGCGTYYDDKPQEPAINAVAIIALIVSVVQIGYGVVLTSDLVPLLSIFSGIAGVASGAFIGALTAEDEGESGSPSNESEHENSPTEDDEAEKDIGWPSALMGVLGIQASWSLFSDGSELLLALLGGKTVEPVDPGFWFVIPGPIVLLGAIMMLLRRGYWIAIVASICCMPMGLSFGVPLFRIAPFLLGIWSLIMLRSPRVQVAFNVGDDSIDESKQHEVHVETIPAAPRGALGQAWDSWWAERDKWFTGAVQSVLVIAFLVSLFMFLSFETSTEPGPNNDDQERHVSVRFGRPTPWFHLETNPELATMFRWQINYFTSSMLVLLVGLSLWSVHWQIEKAKASMAGKKLGWWAGSPSAMIILCTVLMVAAVLFGFHPVYLDTLQSGKESAQKTEAAGDDTEPVDDVNAFHQAAMNGRTDQLKKLIAKGYEINAANSQGETALMQAAKSGQPRIIVMLMLRGADETMRDKKGKSALMHAVEAGQNSSVSTLMNMTYAHYKEDLQFQLRRADPDFTKDLDFSTLHFENGLKWQDNEGETALMKAAASGNSEAFKQLFLWSDQQAQDHEGRTAIMHAIQGQQVAFLDEQVVAAWEYLPHWKPGNRFLGTLTPELLSMKDVSGRTPLALAEEIGLSDFATSLRSFLQAIVDRMTVAMGEADKVRVLRYCCVERARAFRGLGQDAQADSDQRYAEHLSSVDQNSSVPKSVALHQHCRIGNVSGVKQLLDAGTSVNDKDFDGQTPLMTAVANGQRSLALSLVLLGADVHEQDDHGRTAIMIAAENGDAIFLQRLADLETISNHKDTAYRREHLKAFPGADRLLLQQNVDLIGFSMVATERDDNGETAAIKAARAGQWDCLPWISKHVDEILAQDDSGRNIAMYMAINGHKEVFQHLLNERYLGKTEDDINIFIGKMLLCSLEHSLSQLDADGKSALQFGEEHGHSDIATILRQHLTAIIRNQTAEIKAKDAKEESATRNYHLRGLAWRGLGEIEKANDDFELAK